MAQRGDVYRALNKGILRRSRQMVGSRRKKVTPVFRIASGYDPTTVITAG
jgi:hypothetical protein